jgi:hypothetical protein
MVILLARSAGGENYRGGKSTAAANSASPGSAELLSNNIPLSITRMDTARDKRLRVRHPWSTPCLTLINQSGPRVCETVPANRRSRW